MDEQEEEARGTGVGVEARSKGAGASIGEPEGGGAAMHGDISRLRILHLGIPTILALST